MMARGLRASTRCGCALRKLCSMALATRHLSAAGRAADAHSAFGDAKVRMGRRLTGTTLARPWLQSPRWGCRHAASNSACCSAGPGRRAGPRAMGAQAADQDPGRLSRRAAPPTSQRGSPPTPSQRQHGYHRHRRQQDRRRRLHRPEAGRRGAARRLHGRHRHHGPARGRRRSCRARRSRSTSTRSWRRSATSSACRWR